MFSFGIRRPNSRPTTLAFGVLVFLLAAACSTGSSGSTGKDSVTVVQSVETDAITSFECCLQQNMPVVREIQQAPTSFVYDVKTKLYSLQPLMATSWKLINPTTWEFQVRPNVKFSNGEPLTATTVQRSLEIYKANNTIIGLNLGDVTIKAVGDLTFDVITSTQNDQSLPALLTYLWLIPPAYFDAHGATYWANNPIGTGPYVLNKWTKGVEVDLSNNPTYWGPKPHISHLIFRSVQNAGTQVAQLGTGQADLITFLPGEYADSIKNSSNGRLEQGPGVDPVYYFMDAGGGGAKKSGVVDPIATGTGPHPDSALLLRQAINYAIDRDSIIKTILKGSAFPLNCTYINAQLGYTESCKGYSYDPAKAKALLVQAGYPNGVTIQQNCSIGDEPNDQDIGVAVQAQLAQVGIKTTLNCLPVATIAPYYHEGKAVGMSFWDFGPMVNFDTSFWCLFYSQPQGVYYGYTSTPELENLCLQAKAAPTTDARQKLYEQIQDIEINKDALFAPMYNAANIYGANKKLNWSVQPASGQDLYLEDASWSS